MPSDCYISSFILNQLKKREARLTFEEAVAVWLMKWSGETDQIISTKFGTDQERVAAILSEKAHQGARAEAFAFRSG